MFKKAVTYCLLVSFALMSAGPFVYAQGAVPPAALPLNLPASAAVGAMGQVLSPVVIEGLKVRVDDSLAFSFLLDGGDSVPSDSEGFKADVDRQLRYFLASLTVPENDLWVNLSPYESERIVPQALGRTALGQDLLAQDYVLKQLAASLLNPEVKIGKAFWKKVYQLAHEQFGTTDIPIDTFTKVWIVPAQARVIERLSADKKEMTVVVSGARLKVMLEQDYLAAAKNGAAGAMAKPGTNDARHQLAVDVEREVIIPALEEEVNNGRNFASLRQIYHTLILGHWFKTRVKEGLLNSGYVDRSRVAGITADDQTLKDKVYARYVDAFKTGVFNFIKEEQDLSTGETFPRKYFSGGATFTPENFAQAFQVDPAGTPEAIKSPFEVAVRLDAAETVQQELFPDAMFPQVQRIEIPPANREALMQPFMDFKDRWNSRQQRLLGAFTYRQFVPLKDNDPRFLFKEFDALMLKALPGEDIGMIFMTQAGVTPEEYQQFLQSRKRLDEMWMVTKPKETDPKWVTLDNIALDNIDEGVFAISGKNFDQYFEQDRGLTDSKDIRNGREQFFRQYYKHIFRIRSVIMKATLALSNGLNYPTYQINGIPLSDGFVERSFAGGRYFDRESQLSLADKDLPVNEIGFIRDKAPDRLELKALFEQKPALMVKVFYWAVNHKAVISPDIVDAIRQVLEAAFLSGREISLDAQAKEYFIKMLSSPNNVADTLVMMHELGFHPEKTDGPSGLLGRLLPDFARTDGLFAVAEHHFSITYHSLFLLKFLESVRDIQDPDPAPDDKQFYERRQGDEWVKSLKDPNLSTAYERYNAVRQTPERILSLRLGAIFHDIGKDEQYNDFDTPHPVSGAFLAAEVLKRDFQLPASVVDQARKLVHDHQLIADHIGFNPKAGIPILKADLLDLISNLGENLDGYFWDSLYLINLADQFAYRPYKRNVNGRAAQIFKDYYRELNPWAVRDIPDRKVLLDDWEQEVRDNERERLLGKRFLEWMKYTTSGQLKAPEKARAAFDVVARIYPVFELSRMKHPLLEIHMRTIENMLENANDDDKIFIEHASNFIDLGFVLVLVMGMTSDRPGILYRQAAVEAALGFNIHSSLVTNPQIAGKTMVLNRVDSYRLGSEAQFIDWCNGLPDPLRKAFIDQMALKWDKYLVKVNEGDKIAVTLDFNKQTISEKKGFMLDRYIDLLQFVLEKTERKELDVDSLFEVPSAIREFRKAPSHGADTVTVIFEEEKGLSDQEPDRTRMTLNAPDRNGLLYIVSRLLSERFQVNIEGAPVLTPEIGARDVFYLTKDGKPLQADLAREITRLFTPLLALDVITYGQVKALAAGLAPDLQMGLTDPAAIPGGIDLRPGVMPLTVDQDASGSFNYIAGGLNQMDLDLLHPVVVHIRPLQSAAAFLDMAR